MRLKDYARNHKKRKDYVQQPDLLMVGVDVSKVKHDAYLGTKVGIICPSWVSQIGAKDLMGIFWNKVE